VPITATTKPEVIIPTTEEKPTIPDPTPEPEVIIQKPEIEQKPPVNDLEAKVKDTNPFSIEFEGDKPESNILYGKALTIISMYAESQGRKLTPIEQFYFAQQVLNPDGGPISKEDLEAHLKSNKQLYGNLKLEDIKPKPVAGNNLDCTPTEFRYERKEDENRLYALIGRQAKLMRVEDSLAFQSLIKEQITQEYNAPEKGTLSKSMIDQYERRVDALEARKSR